MTGNEDTREMAHWCKSNCISWQKKKNGIKFWSVKPGDRGGDGAKHCGEESTLDEGVSWEKCCCLFKRE